MHDCGFYFVQLIDGKLQHIQYVLYILGTQTYLTWMSLYGIETVEMHWG